MFVKFQKRAVESMAVAEGASPTSAALRSGMWSFFEISSGQKATCLSPLPKSACLQGRNSEQINEASLWCTCNPVASSPDKGVSLLAR